LSITEDARVRNLKQIILTASKILHDENLLDYMGHVSARASEDAFLITPRMPNFQQLTEETIVSVTLGDAQSESNPVLPIELPLHTIIYQRKSAVGSIVHAHPKFAVALSALGRQFRIVHQLCLPFMGGIPIFEDFSMIDSFEKADRMVQELSNHRAIILRYHGVIVTGSTVEQATVLTIWLEKCAELQLIAGEPDVQEIEESRESRQMVEHQLKMTYKAAWNYYKSIHSK
jgi:ribulose-5-phosphate 4-epimerase/fuculose-1-phosphate aldolase